MNERKFYFCKKCNEYLCRIVGKYYGDGQEDSDKNPIYLICDINQLTSKQMLEAESNIIYCGC